FLRFTRYCHVLSHLYKGFLLLSNHPFFTRSVKTLLIVARDAIPIHSETISSAVLYIHPFFNALSIPSFNSLSLLAKVFCLSISSFIKSSESLTRSDQLIILF